MWRPFVRYIRDQPIGNQNLLPPNIVHFPVPPAAPGEILTEIERHSPNPLISKQTGARKSTYANSIIRGARQWRKILRSM